MRDASRLRGTIKALVALVVLYHLAGLYSAVYGVFHSTPGVVLFDASAAPTGVVVMGTTPTASLALQAAGEPAAVHGINGTALSELPRTAGRSLLANRLLDPREGARNTLALEDPRGNVHIVELVAGRASLSELLASQWLGLALALVAQLYLVVGIYVWLRRPADGSAHGLLEISLAAAVNLSFPWNWTGGTFGYWAHLCSQAALPLYAIGGVQLVRYFTGSVERLGRARRVVIALAAMLALTVALTQELTARRLVPSLVERVPLLLAGALLLLVMAGMWIVPRWLGEQPSLALRRRVRVLRTATMVSFFIPTLLLVTTTFADRSYLAWVPPLNLVLIASFPLIVAWAIFRHQLFDLRIVLARGIVVLLLSALVTVAYLTVVLIALRADRAASSPVLLAVTSGGMVALATIAQVRLQRLIHMAVFRSREVYARALARASEELAHARDTDGIAQTLEAALLREMGLTRAYLAVWSSEDRSLLECRPLGGSPDPVTGEAPAPMPPLFAPGAFPAVARAIAAQDILTLYDEAPLERDQRSQGGDPPADFWARHGFEAVVSLDVGREEEGRRVLGVLLLGPKLDGRPLDAEDRDLLATLANHVAVALDNSLAFAEIRRLKDGLERQVEQRTTELRRALADIHEMQAQLVESEKQAMLAHLVAGLVHELNTPLGALRSSTDTIGKSLTRLRDLVAGATGEEGERARRALAAAGELMEVQSASSARIHELVGSLAGFVGLDSAELRCFDVREGIDDALTVLAPDRDHRVEVVRDYAAEIPLVRCRPARLNNAFLNLLTNAREAVPSPGGRIDIRVSVENATVRVVITDNGPGIAPGKLGSLFEFGFTTKHDGRVGLRLGLPLSKRTVEEIGGTLRLSSEPGRGTEVSLELPAVSAETRARLRLSHL